MVTLLGYAQERGQETDGWPNYRTVSVRQVNVLFNTRSLGLNTTIPTLLL